MLKVGVLATDFRFVGPHFGYMVKKVLFERLEFPEKLYLMMLGLLPAFTQFKILDLKSGIFSTSPVLSTLGTVRVRPAFSRSWSLDPKG